jgi:glycosyltransferase involved in cell wall biosynthesis
LAPSNPGLRLDIAGIGPLAARLEQEARMLGIGKRVNFLGFVEDMQSRYAASDLVIQSSFTEGLPNVVLEAGFAGVPIVATDVGGTNEIIEHGVSGWLVRPQSVDALAEGIRSFLQDPDSFHAMAVVARAKIEREFSFDVRTAEQVRIYETIAKQRP